MHRGKALLLAPVRQASQPHRARHANHPLSHACSGPASGPATWPLARLPSQVPETYVGSVVELFAQRKGEMIDMQPSLEVRNAAGPSWRYPERLFVLGGHQPVQLPSMYLLPHNTHKCFQISSGHHAY